MTSADDILEQAIKHHHAGRLAHAEAGYRKVLSMQPGHPGASHMFGVLVLGFGLNDLAVELIGVAIKANPNDPMPRSNMSIALRNQGKFKESAEQAWEAIRLKDDLAEAHINLGLTLMELGGFEEAADEYR